MGGYRAPRSFWQVPLFHARSATVNNELRQLARHCGFFFGKLLRKQGPHEFTSADGFRIETGALLPKAWRDSLLSRIIHCYLESISKTPPAIPESLHV